MKTTFRKLLALSLITLAFTACSDDDNKNIVNPTTSFVVNPNDFKGDILDGNVVLNPSQVYLLTNKLVVRDGATLTIPAGTVIKGVGGTASYIAVAQGGKIDVQGTAAQPVIMTSGLNNPQPGDWGGLVICGKAPINRVTGGASTAQAEVSDLTYGGTIANDNSGSIRYLVVEYAGAAFNSEKEFNAVSFFGVGNGTVVENVEAYHGSDDGFEFFGGTVNTSNLIAIGNEDDQFDWTEGWSGTNTNWYGKIAFGKGNRGIEADNYEFGFANTPIAMPTISNITLIGPGSTASADIYTENDGMKLRRGTHGIFTNVVLANWKTGFNIEHDETIAGIPTNLKANNVSYADIASEVKGKATDGSSVSITNFATNGTNNGAGNGNNQPTWAQGWSKGF